MPDDDPALRNAGIDQTRLDIEVAVPDFTEPDGGSELETSRRVSVEQLASVRSLLKVERRATEYDILITTAFEALRNGPMTDTELVEFSNRVWPGTGIESDRIHRAMDAAQKAGYVGRGSFDGTSKWMLTAQSLQDILSARDWAAETLASTATQLRERLANAGRVVGAQEAQLWTTVLQRALMAGVRGLLAPYHGQVVVQDHLRLTARHYDTKALRRVVLEAAANEPDAELMLGLAMDALNPLSEFGNDLLTTITVGYLLHAVVGRRDRVAAHAVIGALRGDRAILDTPVLLQLLGASRSADPIERVIVAARSADMEVIAPEHYLEELQELVIAVEADNPDVVLYHDGGGATRESPAGSVVGDGVVATWLTGLADGVYGDWGDFKRAALGLGEQLTLLGVVVRPHNNGPSDAVDSFRAALSEEIAERASRPRQALVLERDAQTMAMAYRARARKSHLRAFWPGAWIVTPDTHIGPAYRRRHHDDFPLTLTPASWLAIVSTCSPPAEAEALAWAAGTPLLAQETFMSVAGRFPVKAAIELARMLGPDNGGSILDMHVAQLSLDELLAKEPGLDESNGLTSRIVNEVMRKRADRLNASFVEGSARQQGQVRRMEDALRAETARAEAAAASQREAIATLAEVSAAAGKTISDAQRRVSEAEEGRTADRTVARREAAMQVVFLVLAVGLALAVLNRLWFAAVLVIIGGLVLWDNGQKWASDPSMSWRRLLPAGIIELVALVSELLHWP